MRTDQLVEALDPDVGLRGPGGIRNLAGVVDAAEQPARLWVGHRGRPAQHLQRRCVELDRVLNDRKSAAPETQRRNQRGDRRPCQAEQRPGSFAAQRSLQREPPRIGALELGRPDRQRQRPMAADHARDPRANGGGAGIGELGDHRDGQAGLLGRGREGCGYESGSYRVPCHVVPGAAVTRADLDSTPMGRIVSVSSP